MEREAFLRTAIRVTGLSALLFLAGASAGQAPQTEWTWVQNPSSNNDSANSIAVGPENITVAGSDRTLGASNSQWRITKLYSNGTPAANVTQNPSPNDDEPNGVAVNPSAAYVVGSDRNLGAANSQWRVSKSYSNGTSAWNWTLDSTANDDVATAVALDGPFVYVAGFDSVTATDTRWRVVKLDENGTTLWNWTLDPSGGNDQATAIAVDSTGNITVAGFDRFPGPTNIQWRVVKIDSNGTGLWNYTPDPSLNNDRATSIALDSSDNIYVGGFDETLANGNPQWRVTKLAPNGTSIWNWTQNFGPDPDVINGLAVDSLGSVLAAGFDRSLGASNAQWRVAKISPDGTTDWNWTENLGANDDQANAIAVNPSGIYVAGFESLAVANQQWRVVKLAAPPNITDWSNNQTNDASLFITLGNNTAVRFNGTSSQAGDWKWRVNGTIEKSVTNGTQDDFNYTFNATPLPATRIVNATVSNGNGTSKNVSWTVTISSPVLEVVLNSPSPGPNNQNRNTTFVMNATATCKFGDCGRVNGTARYNASGAEPNQYVETVAFNGSAVPFQVTDDSLADLSDTDPGDWMGTNNILALVYDSANQLTYAGLSGGGFGVYNQTTNTTLNLSATDASDWISTTSINALAYDSTNQLVYLGLFTGKFGVYNRTTNTSTDLSTTDTGNWIGTTAFNALAYDTVNQLVYLGLTSGKFGVYNQSTNTTTNLSDTDIADWIGATNIAALTYDATNQLIYLGLGSGKFGVYYLSNNTTVDLSATDTGNWMGTAGITSLAYDSANQLVYLGLTSGRFGVYNQTTNTSTALSATDPGNWMGTAIVNALAYDTVNQLVYLGLTSGKFGVYNRTTNITIDLSTTDPGNWTGANDVNTLAFDSANQLTFLGAASGKFGRYSGGNPRSCGALDAGQSCTLLFTVNATGTPATWALDVEFLSNDSGIAPNNTSNTLVTITVPEIISVTLNTSLVDFGSLNVSSTDVNAVSGFPINITVESSTNVATNITASASTDGGNHSGGNFTFSTHAADPQLSISNLNFSNASNFTVLLAVSTAQQGNGTFADWGVPGPDGGPAQSRYLYFRITIPATAKGGSYHSHVTVTVSKQGT